MLPPFLRGWASRRLGVVLAALTATVIGFAPASFAETGKNGRCMAADALLEAGEVQEARLVYISILTERPSIACAGRGLSEINAKRPLSCDVADALLASGEKDEAKKTYVDLLRMDPLTPCATAALLAIKQNAEETCSGPQALEDAGEIAAARTAYVEILGENAATRCALTGLVELNDRVSSACADADELFDAGGEDFQAVREAYLEIGRDSACSEVGLKAIRDVERLCEAGNVYADANLDAQARKQYLAALEKSPNAECAIEGVTATDQMWLVKAVEAVSASVTERGPDFVVVLLVLLLALFVLMLFGHFNSVYRVFARMWPFNTILRPRLAVGPLDDTAIGHKVAAAMTSRLREHLQRFRSEALRTDQRGYGLDVGTPAEELADLVSGDSVLKSSLEKIGGASDRSAFVAALVNIAFGQLPIRRLLVGGVLMEAGGAPAVTAHLERDQRLLAAVTLAGDPPPGVRVAPTQEQDGSSDALRADDYLSLVEPLAVWTQYVVTAALSSRDADARQAESHAVLRQGVRHHLAGNHRDALVSYERALTLDPFNWTARANLAMVKAHLVQDFLAAIRILDGALSSMRRMEGPRGR